MVSTQGSINDSVIIGERGGFRAMEGAHARDEIFWNIAEITKLKYRMKYQNYF